jgi:hypothetical protein
MDIPLGDGRILVMNNPEATGNQGSQPPKKTAAKKNKKKLANAERTYTLANSEFSA